MFSQIKLIVACVALTVLGGPSIEGQAVGQECSSCANAAFGFPGDSSCGAAGCGLGHGQLKANIEKAQARNGLIAARNDAWPKPFACLDRQGYENTWRPFIDAGYERQCVLSSAHFDSETNELTRFGETIVAGLVQTMPQARKTIFVHRTSDEVQSQQRLESVRNSVDRMFGHVYATQVSFSNQIPATNSALLIERQRELLFEQTPPPTIPVPSGTEGINAGGGGGGGGGR